MQNQVRVQSWSRSLPERTAAGTSREYNSLCPVPCYSYICSPASNTEEIQDLPELELFHLSQCLLSMDRKQRAVQHRTLTGGMLSSCGTSRTISLFSCAILVIRIYFMCAVSFLADKWDSVCRLLGRHSPQNGGGKAK